MKIILILIIIIITQIYVIYNLLRKNEKLEDNILQHDEFFKNLNSTIIKSNEKISKLDEKGIFKSDDEVGYFFNMLKDIQKQLNKYII